MEDGKTVKFELRDDGSVFSDAFSEASFVKLFQTGPSAFPEEWFKSIYHRVNDIDKPMLNLHLGEHSYALVSVGDSYSGSSWMFDIAENQLEEVKAWIEKFCPIAPKDFGRELAGTATLP
jgi:hypothetical protein